MSDSIAAIIARIEAAMVEAVHHPPTGELGLALVKIGDLRRLLIELERLAVKTAPGPGKCAPSC